MFPGSNYRFLDTYFDTSTAFLDFPGLEIPTPPKTASPELFQRMVLAARNKEAILANGAQAALSTDWQSISGAKRTKSRGRLLQALVNFYGQAEQGDYLIVPSTLSDARVYVGQFVDNAIRDVVFGKYGDHPLPARNINWIAGINENKLSTALSQSLRAQHPFSLVEASRFIEVFAVANQSLVYGDAHVATIRNEKDDFLDVDASLLGNLSKLAAAAVMASEGATTGTPLTTDLLRVLLANVPLEYSCQQESDVHSEGFNRFISAARTPLVIAATLAFLLALPSPLTEAGYRQAVAQFVLENSLAPTDTTCAPPVSAATKLLLNAMDFDTATALCEAATDAERRAGLTPSATAGP